VSVYGLSIYDVCGFIWIKVLQRVFDKANVEKYWNPLNICQKSFSKVVFQQASLLTKKALALCYKAFLQW
jgi:hypothetical protein